MSEKIRTLIEEERVTGADTGTGRDDQPGI